MTTLTAPASAPTVDLRLALKLPTPIADSYKQEAEEYGVPLEELIANRLSACVTYNATKPLYFNDQQRRELETVLAKNLDKPATVTMLVRKAVSVSLNGVLISLGSNVLDRLRTRAPKGVEFKVWMQGQINEWAEQYVGLR